MTPDEVLERFSNEAMIRLVAHQNLYGPIGPRRLDALFARLGMDVAAPHMKKGKRPQFRDHVIEWSRPRKTGRELLNAIRGIQAGFEGRDKRKGDRR